MANSCSIFVYFCVYLFLEINLKKLAKLNGGNVSETSNPQELDAYVPLNKLRRATTFKLKLQAELDEKYNVFVRAERKADVFLGELFYKQVTNNPAVSIATQN